MVFGNEASMEMYKELRNMFEHITRDMFDHVLMTYAPRAAEIRKGNVTPGYVPDGRKIPFKKRKEKLSNLNKYHRKISTSSWQKDGD